MVVTIQQLYSPMIFSIRIRFIGVIERVQLENCFMCKGIDIFNNIVTFFNLEYFISLHIFQRHELLYLFCYSLNNNTAVLLKGYVYH